MAKIIKIQIPGKIYWNGFTRQIKELYFLLSAEKCISCSIDEFLKHFTGKKITNLGKPAGKLDWKTEKYLIVLLAGHLTEKGFLDGTTEENLTIFSEHFKGIPASVLNLFEMNKNKLPAQRFQNKLELLFPATSGYRCKQRLFYKARNKASQSAVLEQIGILI